MNISTLTEARVVAVELQLRDLEVLRIVCRKRGWEFRTGQASYRWFGRWLAAAPRPADLGRCSHAIAIPGCLYEIGLRHRGRHFEPLWDDTLEGGLAQVLGPYARPLWQDYLIEKVRREARRRGLQAGVPIDAGGTLRLRLVDSIPDRWAHVCLTAGGAASLWTFGPDSDCAFHDFAEELGTILPDPESCP